MPTNLNQNEINLQKDAVLTSRNQEMPKPYFDEVEKAFDFYNDLKNSEVTKKCMIAITTHE